MSRALITINGAADRERAARWSMQAATGTRIEFKQAKRSGEQNDKLWAMLTEVATQVPWHGIKLHADDWKFIFLDALKRELRVVPNIDGTGFVNLGRSSSDLSKAEMSDLIELIHAFGAGHGVVFKDQDSISTEQAQPPQSDVRSDEPAAVSADSAAGDLSNLMDPSALPEGWPITYSAALCRAQKKDSLAKYATQYWADHGGWEVHKDTPDGATAAAIFNAFRDNFGNREQIELLLRELI